MQLSSAFLFLCVFAIISLSLGEKVRFDGDKVIRARISNLTLIHDLEERGFDFWAHSTSTLHDVRVSPSQLREIERLGIAYKEFIPNVQQLIDEQEASLKSVGQGNFFSNYQRHSVIVAYMEGLAARHSFVQFVPSIGLSIQGRTIPALEISIPGPARPVLFINGGMHAREWISCATVLYLTTQLVENYGNDNEVDELLNAFDIMVVPMTNPDGYEYSHTTNRMWRKSRRQNTGGSFGVDLNRNWDDIFYGENIWCTVGASRTPSSDTYCGTAAFSEPETRALADYWNERGGGNIYGGIDYHSYSQLILRPYANSYDVPPNEDDLKALGDGMSDAIYDDSGVYYNSEPGVDLYPTSGTADSWYYQNCHPSSLFGYCIELRDTGNFGFLLPPAQIIPTGQENYAAFKFFGKFLKDRISNK